MNLNWKTILGSILIVSSFTNLFRTFKAYHTGAIESWPLGVETGLAIMVVVGALLIRSGIKT